MMEVRLVAMLEEMERVEEGEDVVLPVELASQLVALAIAGYRSQVRMRRSVVPGRRIDGSRSRPRSAVSEEAVVP